MAASQNGKPLFYAGLTQMDGVDCRMATPGVRAKPLQKQGGHCLRRT
jgi:hypothetical protein